MKEEFLNSDRFWERAELDRALLERRSCQLVVACVIAAVGWTALIIIWAGCLTGWK